jgi:hypothetical protein
MQQYALRRTLAAENIECVTELAHQTWHVFLEPTKQPRLYIHPKETDYPQAGFE